MPFTKSIRKRNGRKFIIPWFSSKNLLSKGLKLRSKDPENLPFNETELLLFKELLKRNIPFMIVGLSAAILQGVPVVTQDVDLWVKTISDPNFQEAIRSVGGAYIPTIMLNPPQIGGPGLELLDLVSHMHGLKSFEEEYQKCDTVLIKDMPIKVLPLDRIIASKEAAGRPKDKMVMYALKDALIVLEEKKKSQRKGD